MDIGPMNLQMIVPRTSDATQVQHNLNKQDTVQQEFASIREQTEHELRENSVRSKEDNTEEQRIKDDLDREGKGGKRHKKHAANPGQEDETAEDTVIMAADPNRGLHIDISL